MTNPKSYINPTTQQENPPTLTALLDILKREIGKDINCVRIGVIQSFNETNQHAEVKIAQQQVTSVQNDGTRTLAEYPILLDVPVHFQCGGGYTMTFPITEGDECLILFNDREIDNWLDNGPGLPPTIGRLHDLSDGFAIVGVRSNNRVLSGVSTTTTQLRSDDGETYVEVNKTGVVTVKAPEMVVMETPLLRVTGVLSILNENSEANGCAVSGDIKTVDGDVLAETISLRHHVHSGVQTGGGNTGQPVV